MNVGFWLCVMVMFIIIEASTTALVSVWFAVGALVSAVCSYCGLKERGCVLVFLIVSTIALTLFKLFYNKKMTPKHEPTNADRVVGMKGIVSTAIDPITGKGIVEVKGNLWSAKADEGIEVGSVVHVEKIEGVKLVVKKV